MQYYFTDELYHHGIKGQRWGHRKITEKEYKDKWEQAGNDKKSNAIIGASIGALAAIPAAKLTYTFSKKNKGRNAAIAALAVIGGSTAGMVLAGKHTAKQMNRSRKPNDSKKYIR